MPYKLVALLLLFAGAPWTFAAEALCPVTKRPGKEKYSLDHEGVRYFFSSRGAMKLFALRPSRYVTPKEKQQLCPVTGKAIDEKVFIDYEGRRVFFCSTKCIPAFNGKAKHYLKKLAERKEHGHDCTDKSCGSNHGPCSAEHGVCTSAHGSCGSDHDHGTKPSKPRPPQKVAKPVKKVAPASIAPPCASG